MSQKWLVWVGLVWIVLPVGCRRDVASSREEFAGVMTAGDGKAYIPMKVPVRKGDTILGAIAGGAEQPGGERGSSADDEAEAPEEVMVDDSSAEAVAESLVAIMNSGDLSKLPDVVPPDQTEIMQEMVEAYGDLAKAARELKLALDEKIPDHNAAGFFPISETLGHLIAEEVSVQEVRDVSDEEAQAIFAYVPAGGEAKTLELTIRKVEDSWRIVLPDFRPPPDIAATAELDKDKAPALSDIARRVRSGNLADMAAVDEQLAEVAGGTYKPAEESESDSDAEEPGDNEQADSRAQPPPQPRQREAVDEVYSGPGMLRGR